MSCPPTASLGVNPPATPPAGLNAPAAAPGRAANARVDVLLSTYNGAAWLPELLHSLERQTLPDWRLIARDDGSSDATTALLEAFVRRHAAGRVLLIEGGANLGVVGSFSLLLSRATAAWVAPADQDDVWAPEKLAVLCEAGEQAARGPAAAGTEPGRAPGELPTLVHADLCVVDARLAPLAQSFWRYQRIDPSRDRTAQLLVQNVVTGCACLFNQPLARLALPLPPEASRIDAAPAPGDAPRSLSPPPSLPHACMMHDWWLALLASAAGRIVPVHAPLVFYRQHGANQLGARRYAWSGFLRRASRLGRSFAVNRRLFAQAAALADRLAERGLAGASAGGELVGLLEGFSRLGEASRWERYRFWRSCAELRKAGGLRNAAFLASLLLMPRRG